MRAEFLHGPIDGMLREVPDGTRFFEVSMPGDKEPWNIVIHRYEFNKSVMTTRATNAFVYVGIRSSSRRTSKPKLG
jgi:hypothetical protein